ncbi:class I SAM-dependent methyltransferase [Romeria aff. gracilis LEGE 07310]|uniref:Class I SAM-dependent methyltransferase n=1 Tax=Vasconcelosia minhoensis LEGE 07310 TaxID=915328 RepID=A0A8J7AQ66_9CYAN|nr:class I SAM-dependent methyltransferase [Romeria gracilis]MBE9078331.1 class I SAM-dependent methyltransferase [Romeria aff. gracilis LEGE 07310]
MSAQDSDWFEPLYADALAQGDPGQIPWALMEVTPYLQDWLEQAAPESTGRSAVVVACGLGDDAEALANYGFEVTAFDISATAIAWCQQRFPNSSVHYQVADLFQLPPDWRYRFDLVYDFRTIQALPVDIRPEVIEQIAALAAPGGTALIATYIRQSETPPDSAPWPLTLAELAHFEALGLEVVRQDRFVNRDSRFRDRVRVEYRVPQAVGTASR